MNAERKPVDVLAVMNFACEVICEYSPAGARSDTALKLMQARADVAELVVSHKRLLAMAEKARLPKTGDQCIVMTEARDIAARIGEGA